MKRLITLAAFASLGACTTIPQSPSQGVQTLGDGLYSISQRAVPFGSTAQRASAYCNSFGQQVRFEGSSTEQTLWSDQVYSVLIFRCV